MPPPWAQTPSGALLNCEKKLLCCSYCVGIESFSRGRTLIITHWMARKYSGVFFLRERSLLLVVRICLWKLTLLHVALGVLLLLGFYCIYRYFSLFYSFGFVSFVFLQCMYLIFVFVCGSVFNIGRWIQMIHFCRTWTQLLQGRSTAWLGSSCLYRTIFSAKSFISFKALVTIYLLNTLRSHFSIDGLYTAHSTCSRCHNHASLPCKLSAHCCSQLYSFAQLIDGIFLTI